MCVLIDMFTAQDVFALFVFQNTFVKIHNKQSERDVADNVPNNKSKMHKR